MAVAQDLSAATGQQRPAGVAAADDRVSPRLAAVRPDAEFASP